MINSINYKGRVVRRSEILDGQVLNVLGTICPLLVEIGFRGVVPGGAKATPVFDRSVNSISTMGGGGGQIMPTK
jgi:hypothetical protein